VNDGYNKIGAASGLCLMFLLLAPIAFGQQTLSLHDAIEAGLTSPTARISAEQIGVAQGQVQQAGLRPNPRLYLQSEDIRPWDNNFSFTDNTEDYGYIGQSIELAGKRGKRIALASANLHRSEAEHTLRNRQIAASVAAAYWMLVADLRIAQLLRQDIAEVDDMVRYNKDRVNAGATRGVDLIRMQIERDRIYLSLQAAERDAELARIDLGRQIGRTLPADVNLTDDLSVVDQLPAIDLATALAQRADVAVARQDVAAAEADLKLQHAMAVPDPDLIGGYKRNVGIDTAYGGLQILLPIFNRNQGEVARAQAQLRVAQASLEQTEIMVRADIDGARANYTRETAIVRDTLPPMRARARQNLTILTEAYRIGGVDLLRYIDAERTEIDVEVTAIRTLADFHQAALRLQFALGVQP
jgi:cobalt-zinc-cadmium efflux system outer membrane protein